MMMALDCAGDRFLMVRCLVVVMVTGPSSDKEVLVMGPKCYKQMLQLEKKPRQFSRSINCGKNVD